MNRFLVLMCALLVLSLLVTIGVWVLLQSALQDESAEVDEVSEMGIATTSDSVVSNSAPDGLDDSEPPPVPAVDVVSDTGPGQVLEVQTQTYAPIPLSTLNISPDQESLLSTVGIDVATFVITPQMQECAYAKIEADRLQEILAGDSPSLGEGIRLSSCFR